MADERFASDERHLHRLSAADEIEHALNERVAGQIA